MCSSIIRDTLDLILADMFDDGSFDVFFAEQVDIGTSKAHVNNGLDQFQSQGPNR